MAWYVLLVIAIHCELLMLGDIWTRRQQIWSVSPASGSGLRSLQSFVVLESQHIYDRQ